VISTVQKFVLFLGLTTQGSMHDFALLKEEFPPLTNHQKRQKNVQDWFENLEKWVDLGYVGITKEYEGKTHIPHKKPKKSESNPEPKLTTKQKEENTQMSKTRIFVENAIGGIKRYYILVHKYRNKRKNFDEGAIEKIPIIGR